MTAPGTHSHLDRPPHGLRIATARDGADVVIRLGPVLRTLEVCGLLDALDNVTEEAVAA